MEQTKNYSLLRPFDLEAAKRGELVCWGDGDGPLRYVGKATGGAYAACFEWIGGTHNGTFETYARGDLRMAPLCWVEGRPVYKGDTLYFDDTTINPGRALIVHSANDTRAHDQGGNSACLSRLTWNKPNPVLCEVEGKPVRKGDRLWSNYFKVWFAVTEIEDGFFVHERGVSTPASSCSWKRKVTKQGFINIYPPKECHGTSAVASTATTIYPNKGAADALATSDRIACIAVEWTEEVDE